MPAVGLMLLAAGGSRRLGMPKQLLRDDQGQSLIRRAAQIALASSCRPVAIVLGASADSINREIEDLPLVPVINPVWETGMASSLHAGLTALTADAPLDAVIVMLCDQPQVSTALLDSLVQAYSTSWHELVVCEYGDVLGPPALFGQSLFEALRSLNGDEGARRIIKNYPGPITSIDFPGGLFDIDQPGDVEILRRTDIPPSRK